MEDIEDLRQAMRLAGIHCDIPYDGADGHGDDWPDAVASALVKAREELQYARNRERALAESFAPQKKR